MEKIYSELKATNGGSTRMKAGRKTTSEERLEIALYAIEHGKIILPQLRNIMFLINKYIIAVVPF